MAIADKLQKAINGKQSIVDLVNAKANTSLPLNCTWETLKSTLENVKTGGATIKTNGGWQGTAVPNEGYVEKVYFNTNLSVEEVIGLFSNYIGSCLLLNETYEHLIIINKDNVINASVESFVIIDGENILFTDYEGEELNFTGWNPAISNGLEINSNVLSIFSPDSETIIPIGTQNNLLTSLFSTTPFTQSGGETIELTGEYNGNPIETSESEVNVKELINAKQIPLNIKFSGGNGGSAENYPSESIAYYKATRNKNYPILPLPYEMQEKETQDTIYMLYDATGYRCCPSFNINNSTNVVCTIQKYMNTILVTENNVTIDTSYANYMQFSEEDSDWHTYNYLVIKLQGNIINHAVNCEAKFNNYRNSNNSTGLIEVSGKCNSCEVKVVNTSSSMEQQRLEYYSFLGVKNTSMQNMFYNCTMLKVIPELDTSFCTDMRYMFKGCYELKVIPELDTSKATNMQEAFRGCYSLTKIPLLNTSNLVTATSLFNQCKLLQVIPQLDMNNVSSSSYIFSGVYNLAKFDVKNIKISFELNNSNLLTQSELVKILNNLATVETTKTLTLGSTNLAKLTDEQKAIATEKNWTLA